MREIRFFLLTLLSLLYVTNVSALVKGNTFTRDGITYRVTFMDRAHDGLPERYEVEVASSTKTGAVTIPDKVYDLDNQYNFTVSGIGNACTIPGATSVVLPSTIKRIGANVFAKSNITSITIPKGTDDISDGAFAQMSELTEIKVESGNTKYSATGGVLYENRTGGKYLKSYPVAKAGTSFSVPNDVYGVAVNAFQLAANLTRIDIPASVKDLATSKEANSFTSADKLKEIKVDAGNTAYKDVDGVVLTKDGKTLVTYPHDKWGTLDPAYDAPASIDPTHAMLKGNYYKIPDGVETIAKGAFAQVRNVTAIKLNNVKTLEEGAFYSPRNLRNIEISASVKTIQDGAISGTPTLFKFTVDSANPDYSADSEGVIYNHDKTELVLFPAGKSGEYTTLPTTKKIRKRAFYYAQKVEKIHFNKDLEEIDNDAFQAAVALKEITFDEPSKLKRIGTWAFFNTGLESLRLPASLETLDDAAFRGSSKLKTVTVAAGSKLKKIGAGAFYSNTNLESFTFEGATALETIGQQAFMGAAKLKKFNIPASVKSIESAAFEGTSSMKEVTFATPAQITKITEGAFQSASALEKIELPVSVKEIEKDAFNKCKSLKEIVIPKDVNKIDPTGFQQCESLEKYTVDKANTTYSSVDGFLLSKDKKKLVSFPPAKAGTYYTMLPPTIEEIGQQAFYDIQKLENVTLPANVKKIDKWAFDLVKNLNTIAFLGMTPVAEADIDGTAFNPLNVDKKKIQINVRKDAKAAYAANNVWKTFKNIGVSFWKETNGTGNGATEYFPLSQKAVMIVDTKADVFTYVVQPEVTNPDDNKNYEVRLWGDYALKQNTTNIKEVVFKNTLDYMGIDAFKKADGTSTVERIYFTAPVPTKDMSATKWELTDLTPAQHEFDGQLKHIYVKKSVENAYKTATGWTDYAGVIDYKIKDEVKIAHQYGTFAREFDADLGIYARENGDNGRIGAFVAQTGDLKKGTVAGNEVIKCMMKSINYNTNVPAYDYVPAETGVLLESRSGLQTPADFYYAIGEEDNTTYTIANNVMEGVTVKNKKMQLASSDATVFAMTKSGLFKPLKLNVEHNLPVHKAVAKLQVSTSSPAKVMFVFDDGSSIDAETTGIEHIANTTAADDNVYYNLQGQRVEHPQHGVFIHNGKKVVLK